jgi:hypothetical protein
VRTRSAFLEKHPSDFDGLATGVHTRSLVEACEARAVRESRVKHQWNLSNAALYGALLGIVMNFGGMLAEGRSLPSTGAGMIAYVVGSAAGGALMFAAVAYVRNRIIR